VKVKYRSFRHTERTDYLSHSTFLQRSSRNDRICCFRMLIWTRDKTATEAYKFFMLPRSISRSNTIFASYTHLSLSIFFYRVSFPVIFDDEESVFLCNLRKITAILCVLCVCRLTLKTQLKPRWPPNSLFDFNLRYSSYDHIFLLLAIIKNYQPLRMSQIFITFYNFL